MTDETFKKQEKEIRDLKFALDQSSIVAFTNVEGTITYVNDRFCEISKYSRQELVGKNHRIINSGFHSREFFADLWKAISSGKVWKGEVKNRAKDGSYYWVFTTIVPFLNEKGVPYQYVAIRTDITDRKIAEEQIEQDRMRLVYSEKMASLGEVAAGIAHELGNPLAAIAGRMEFLEMRIAQAGRADIETVTNTIKTVQSLTDRMTRIIRGMRTLSRDGSKDPFDKCSVSSMVQDVLEFSKEKFAKSGVELSASGLDSEVEIYCRETQISQVLINLLSNGRDAVQDLSDRWVRLGMEDQGSFVEISVTDSGQGIPGELREKIMMPFFSTKAVGRGTGLGLSISKAIVDGHQGRLDLDTQNANTRFVVRLPKNPRL